MSLTVPCKTSSGIERQRLPVVQFEPGPTAPMLRIGLTTGSLRPAAPMGLTGGFFSATAGGGTPATFAGTAGTLLPLALVLAGVGVAFGWTAITAGALPLGLA